MQASGRERLESFMPRLLATLAEDALAQDGVEKDDLETESVEQ